MSSGDITGFLMSVCTDSLFQRLVSVSNQTSCQETIKHDKVHPSRCLPLLEGSPPACRLRLFLYCTYCVRLYKACCCVTSCPWTLTYEDDETERLAALKRLLPTPPPSPTSDLWPLNSELWSLCSDLIKDWAGRGGIWRVRRARWHPTWTLKSGLNCCFSALFVSVVSL